MIDSYSFGSITINNKVYNSDVIIYPDRVNSSWWRKVGHELCPEDIQEILEQKPEVLIVGTGDPGLMKILPDTKEVLKEKDIELLVYPTRDAVKIYNEICQKRLTIAALHLTC